MTDPLLVHAIRLLVGDSEAERRASGEVLRAFLAAERKRLDDERSPPPPPPPEPDPGPYRDREGRLRDSAGVLLVEEAKAPEGASVRSEVLATRPVNR